MALCVSATFPAFNPQPIKHGIKVFGCHCSYTGYTWSYEIYTGKDTSGAAKDGKADGSAIAVIKRLLEGGGFEARNGHILYTDNYYTSLDTMIYLWGAYHMLMVGTHRLTKKKSRTGSDFPFHKIANGALKMVPRGWLRVAARIVPDPRQALQGLFTVMAVVWKDRKQVAFLSNHMVQPATEDDEVERYDSRARADVPIPCHPITQDYQAHMNGVDRKDRAVADWTMSIRTARYYLRIFFWAVDTSIHCMFVITCEVVNGAEHPADHPWHGYLNKDSGRYKFQMDLAQALVEYAIEQSWDGTDEEGKPGWMRDTLSKGYVPCGCGTCYFCQGGITHGVDHRIKGARRRTPAAAELVHPTNRVSMYTTSRRCGVCSSKLKGSCTPCSAAKGAAVHHQSTKGCPACNVVVCKCCWPSYKHDKTGCAHSSKLLVGSSPCRTPKSSPKATPPKSPPTQLTAAQVDVLHQRIAQQAAENARLRRQLTDAAAAKL